MDRQTNLNVIENIDTPQENPVNRRTVHEQ